MLRQHKSLLESCQSDFTSRLDYLLELHVPRWRVRRKVIVVSAHRLW